MIGDSLGNQYETEFDAVVDAAEVAAQRIQNSVQRPAFSPNRRMSFDERFPQPDEQMQSFSSRDQLRETILDQSGYKEGNIIPQPSDKYGTGGFNYLEYKQRTDPQVLNPAQGDLGPQTTKDQNIIPPDRIPSEINPGSILTEFSAQSRQTPGLLESGNIDLNNRPVVENEDGTVSTVRSMSVNIDGKEVLIPTVASDGSKILSDEEAIKQYEATGQHLGKFDTPENASAYAQRLHTSQENLYNYINRNFPTSQEEMKPGPAGYNPEAKGVVPFLDRIGEAIGQKLEDTKLKAIALAKYPTEYYQNFIPGDLITDEAANTQWETAKTLMGAGASTSFMRPSGLGIFGGRMSKEAIQAAENMEAKGVPEDQIKRLTGLERGAEGKWRLEISDAASDLKLWNFKQLDTGEKSAYLGNVFKHPRFYQAYPEAQTIEVFRVPKDYPLLGKGNEGVFQPRTGQIFLREDLSTEKAKSVLLHEIQHWVQLKEGFAIGTKSQIPVDLADAAKGYFIRKYGKENLARIEKLLDFNKVNFSKEDAIANANIEAKRLLDRSDYELYRHISGETEARNVQKRMNYSENQIRLLLGKTTEDVPRREQLVIEQKLRTNPNTGQPEVSTQAGSLYSKTSIDVPKENKPWPEEFKNQVKSLIDLGLTRSQIRDQIPGLTKGQLDDAAVRFNWDIKSPHREWTTKEVKLLTAYADQGLTPREIIERFKTEHNLEISKDSLVGAAKNNDIALTRDKAGNPKNPSIFSDEKLVKQFKLLHDTGSTKTEIAKALGIVHRSVTKLYDYTGLSPNKK